MSEQPEASDGAESSQRRERKRVHTRRRLYEAAMQLFEEKGYDETTMDEIAELADTARATAYNYFPRKSGFLQEWTERRRQQVSVDLQAGRSDQPVDALVRGYLRDLARINIEQTSLTRVLLPAWVRSGGPIEEEPYLAEVLTDYLRIGQDRGEVRADCDPVLGGHVIRNAYLGALYLWMHSLDDAEPLDLLAAVDESADIILRGLGTAAG